MDKFIELITTLFDKLLADFIQAIGFDADTSKAVTAVVATMVVGLVTVCIKKMQERFKDSRTAKELVHFRYDYKDVKQKRDLYIPTQSQNISPNYEEEPGEGTKFIVKKEIIPFFIKTAFNEKKESNKFYLVLADSGMGKTTFMINLYLQYHSLFNLHQKYKMKLLPFADNEILTRIKDIKHDDACNTILLLDAFDEYKALLPPEIPDELTSDERFHKVLDVIVEHVKDFREVIITSRTQYFPSQEDQPYILKIPRFGREGFHELVKLYLSPFDKSQINHYLNKKYGILKIWNYKKKLVAASVVENSPKLMVRPMLLSYIDYLVDDSNREFKHTYDIYNTLIDKWIDREVIKRKHKFKDQDKFRRSLYDYSRHVALEIYSKRKENNLLTKEEALEICHNNNIELKNYEITGQSLLTRDALQNWKFAHKSILEFFIAKEAIQDMCFLMEVDFSGIDMALQFYREKAEYIYIKGGTFLMGSPDTEEGRNEECEVEHRVKVNDFYLAKHTVTLKQFEKFIEETDYQTDAEKGGGSRVWTGKNWQLKSAVNWRCDVKGNIQKDKQHPVIHVSWNDATEYCQWLNNKMNATYRLPTEAQWEYACRAGTKTPFSTGKNLTSKQANYDGKYPYKNNPKGKFVGKTTPVGSYLPNAWGIFDMHGNVWEWCQDWYDENYYETCKRKGIVENPSGPKTGSYRVLRGGGWHYGAQDCRSAYRSADRPDGRYDPFGFRLVFVPQSDGGS